MHKADGIDMPKPKEPPANRQDLIQYVANEAGLSMSQAKQVVDTMLKGIVHLVDTAPYLQISGFGRFETRDRKARVNLKPIAGGSPIVNEGYSTIWFRASPTLQISHGEGRRNE